MYRKALGLLLTILLTAGASVWASDNQVLAEVRFVAHNGAEKKAGVWVDGQYLGYVKELNGDKKMLLLPGKHEIIVRQAWYRDYVEQALLEPGEIHTIKLAMAKQSSAVEAGLRPAWTGRIPVPTQASALRPCPCEFATQFMGCAEQRVFDCALGRVQDACNGAQPHAMVMLEFEHHSLTRGQPS